MRDYHRDYGTFELQCWDNGLSYALTHKATQRQACVQGDDASCFEREWLETETRFPDKTGDEIMLYLWDQLDYGSAATDKKDKAMTDKALLDTLETMVDKHGLTAVTDTETERLQRFEQSVRHAFAVLADTKDETRFIARIKVILNERTAADDKGQTA